MEALIKFPETFEDILEKNAELIRRNIKNHNL